MRPPKLTLFTGVPQVGEVHFGRELGFKDRGHHYEWRPCLYCGKCAWRRLDHSTKRCPQCNPSGDRHPQWKGGMTKIRGYVVIHRPDHPHCDPNGYVKRCRIVLEELFLYAIPTSLDVHHINGDKLDDRPENLAAVSRQEHMRLHRYMAQQKQEVLLC